MSSTRRGGFFCEAQGCRYKAPFKTRGALSNHQKACKAFREEGEQDLQQWKKQRLLEADAEAREAERLHSMEADPPTISADSDVIVRSSIHSSYLLPD